MTTTPPTEPPTEPAAPVAPDEVGASAPDVVPVYDRAERGRWSTGRAVGLAVATLVVGAVGGWLIGHSGASGGGPSTLAEAMAQARAGDLPTGDMAGNFRAGPGGGANGNGSAPGGPSQSGGGPGGGVFGTIKAIDGDTITIDTQAGDVQVKTTDSTTVQRTVEGTVADLAAGDSVRVESADQSSGGSGTVTAESIQEVPEGAGVFSGRPPGGGGSNGSSGGT